MCLWPLRQVRIWSGVGNFPRKAGTWSDTVSPHNFMDKDVYANHEINCTYSHTVPNFISLQNLKPASVISKQIILSHIS